MEKNQIYEILEEQYFGGSPHEQQEIAGLKDIIPATTKRVIDVGASLGQYTKAFAQVLGTAEIIAIEADPVRFDRLKDHCEDWQQQFGANIRVIYGAACDAGGEATFFTTESNVSGAINLISERSSSWTEIRVPAHTLDDLCTDKNNTFIKMDIEGGEFGAISGAIGLLDGEKNVFLLELHVWGDQKRNKTVSDVLAFFQERNYRISRYHGHYMFQKADRPNSVKYFIVAMSFRLKRIVYFSPFRNAAIGFKRIVRRIFGGQA